MAFCSAQRARRPWWQRPIDLREDFGASLDHLVGYQRAGLAERIIVSHWAGGAKLHRARGTAIDRSHLHVPPQERQRRPPIRPKTTEKSGNAASPFLAQN